jgi:hypothetical protein
MCCQSFDFHVAPVMRSMTFECMNRRKLPWFIPHHIWCHGNADKWLFTVPVKAWANEIKGNGSAWRLNLNCHPSIWRLYDAELCLSNPDLREFFSAKGAISYLVFLSASFLLFIILRFDFGEHLLIGNHLSSCPKAKPDDRHENCALSIIHRGIDSIQYTSRSGGECPNQ